MLFSSELTKSDSQIMNYFDLCFDLQSEVRGYGYEISGTDLLSPLKIVHFEIENINIEALQNLQRMLVT